METSSACTEEKPSENSGEPPRLLTVAIREETLVALFAQGHLCAEELHCPTARARQQLRKILLQALLSVST